MGMNDWNNHKPMACLAIFFFTALFVMVWNIKVGYIPPWPIFGFATLLVAGVCIKKSE